MTTKTETLRAELAQICRRWTRNTNPAETLTDDMIRALQDEAMLHGDDLLMAVCDVALATGWAETAEIDERQRGALEALGVVPEHVGSDDIARAICASVIRDVSVWQEID